MIQYFATVFRCNNQIFYAYTEIPRQINARFNGKYSARYYNVRIYGRNVTDFMVFQADGVAKSMSKIFPVAFFRNVIACRCPCRTALVIAETNGTPRDWAQEQADRWHARLLQSPHSGQLNGTLGGWQWGMKLMQEMLLSK